MANSAATKKLLAKINMATIMTRKRTHSSIDASLMLSRGRGDALNLFVPAKENDHAHEIQDRRRQKQEPAYRRQRRHRKDVTNIRKEIGEAEARSNRQPHGTFLPTPQSKSLAQSERGPLAPRTAQKGNVQIDRQGMVKDAKPEI